MPNRSDTFLIIGSSSKWRQQALAKYFCPTDRTEPLDVLPHIPVVKEVFLLPPDIDEKSFRGPTPASLCTAVAEAKMQQVLRYLSGEATMDFGTTDDAGGRSDRVINLEKCKSLFNDAKNGNIAQLCIITGDQIAVFNGEVREKPNDTLENTSFLQSYRGTYVETVACTVIACIRPEANGGLRQVSDVNWTKTYFKNSLSDEAIQRAIANGDTMQCCGGFTVDDPALKDFIEKMEPSQEAVEGVDINAVNTLLGRMA